MLIEDFLDFFGAVDHRRVDLKVLPLQITNPFARLGLLHRNQQPFVGLAHHAAQAIIGLVEAAGCLLGLVLVEIEAPLLHIGYDGLPCQNGAHLLFKPVSNADAFKRQLLTLKSGRDSIPSSADLRSPFRLELQHTDQAQANQQQQPRCRFRYFAECYIIKAGIAWSRQQNEGLRNP